MLDPRHIGTPLPAFKTTTDASRLRFFAKSIGESDPVYLDEAAARDAGHPGLPLPPTFLFSLELENTSSKWHEEVGIRIEHILHGEQSFRYHRMAYAGDNLNFEGRITDIYSKKGGALSFVVKESRVSNQKGEHVADLRSVIVHRN